MRHLVRADVRRAVTKRGRRGRWLQQDRRAVGDQPGVLHREPDAQRNRDVIELRERIVDAEPALFQCEELGKCAARRTRAPAFFPRGAMRLIGVDRLPSVPALTVSQWPTANATRYDGSGSVAANRTILRAPSSSRLGDNRRVRDGDHVARHAQRQLPWHLESRLVEAGKRPPRGRSARNASSCTTRRRPAA